MGAALIASGAYVSADIAAEFGRIPPAFLPLGNRRLFEWQVEELRRSDPDRPVFLSLPAGFDLGEDAGLLKRLRVTAMEAPAGASLGESLTFVILAAGLLSEPLLLLHGDTLLRDFPFDHPDVVSVSRTRTFYDWADVAWSEGPLQFAPRDPDRTERRVLTGGFTLADPTLFLRCLALGKQDLITALETYSATRPLAMSDEGDWFDFGHLQTYFQSRRRMTTQRHFNTLEVEDHFFVKSSINSNKIAAEERWFSSLPEPAKIYTPLVTAGDSTLGAAAYRIEYCYLATLSDLLVYGRLPLTTWRSILDACVEFLEMMATYRAPEQESVSARELYRDKTFARLGEFSSAGGDIEQEWILNGRRAPSLLGMAELLADCLPEPAEAQRALIHGDFCFSNIMFDFRTRRIKVIDPRGVAADGRRTMFGDTRYEVGKLHHSVVGCYDHIIAGRYELRSPGARELELTLPAHAELSGLRHLFLETRFNGLTPGAQGADAVSALLFLSMLPLHSDDPARQQALMANAIRLFLQWEADAG